MVKEDRKNVFSASQGKGPKAIRNNVKLHDVRINLHIYDNNGLFSRFPTPELLETMKWKYNDDIGTVDPSSIILGPEKSLDSRYGYKIKLNYPYSATMVLDGFLPGTIGNPNSGILLEAKLPNEPFRETWVGYYNTNSVEPLIALSDIESDLIEIKTQYWALNRASVFHQWPSIASI